MRNLYYNVTPLKINADAAGDTTTVTTDTFDMRGYESALVMVILGDVADTSKITVTAQHGDESDGGDAADTVAAVSTTAGATNHDDKIILLGIDRPQKRYITVTIDRGVANAAIDSVIAVLGTPNEMPVTHGDVVVKGATFLEPVTA